MKESQYANSKLSGCRWSSQQRNELQKKRSTLEMLNSYKISEYKQDFRPPLPRHSTNTARVHFKGQTSDPYVSKRNSIRLVDSSSPWQRQKTLHSPDDDINSNDSLISKESPASSPRRQLGSPHRNGHNLNFENLASNKL